MRAQTIVLLSSLFLLLGCGDDDVVADAGADAAPADSSADVAEDAPPSDTAPSDASVLPDVPTDVPVDAPAADAPLLDVGVDAPTDAGPDVADATMDAGVSSPECRFIGTRSEGWYQPDGTRICWTFCSEATAVCQFSGTRSEGWYADPTSGGCFPDDRGRIAYDRECDGEF